MSLKFGYDIHYPQKSKCSNDSAVTTASLGTKADDKTTDTAFGRIKKNKDDLSDTNSLVGTKVDSKTTDTAFGRIKKNKDDISNTVNTNSLVGTKADVKTTDTAFGRIEKNKDDLSDTNSIVGTKADAKTTDTAFGRIEKNKDDLSDTNSIVGPANALEGTPNLKGTQLSHASAIAAHSNNLLELENSVGKLVPKVKSLDSLVGTKADAKTTDTAFGKIKKIENNIGDIDEITNSTAIEKVSTSYWWLFDVSLRQRRLEVCSRGRRTNRRLHRIGN